MAEICWARNAFRLDRAGPPADVVLDFLGPGAAAEVQAYHHTWPGYVPTRFVALPALAERVGLERLWVKDEGDRFGLQSFKVLGGSYALGRALGERAGAADGPLTYAELTGTRERVGPLTFVTASDGNHGLGVAWTAGALGHRAVVYLPAGTTAARIRSVRALGAQAEVTDGTYDESVEWAAAQAARRGWVLVQDTAWPGYERVPRWVMQGYLTLAREVQQQMVAEPVPPTHVFLQGGVGSFAAATVAFWVHALGPARPRFVVVEPETAAGLFQSALAPTGDPHPAQGPLTTIMAGLSCGRPNPLAWAILRRYVDVFVTCPDGVAARGMRVLGNPLGEDSRIVAGESGAVTAGLLRCLAPGEGGQALRDELQLDETARVVLICTESDTDPDMYRRIVWDGAYPWPPVGVTSVSSRLAGSRPVSGRLVVS